MIALLLSALCSPALPQNTDGFPGLAAGHPVAYMWVEQ